MTWLNLTTLVALPFVGALVVMCLPRTGVRQIRTVATITTLLTCAVSIILALRVDTASGAMQLIERVLWIPPVNIWYHVGVDGISLPLVLLTTVLGVLACLASFGITERVKEYFVFYLLLITGMLGTFVALDLFLFYVFWEVVLVPMYFLIGIWGGGRREYSAMKFFLYTLAGSLAMLLGILTIYLHTGTFDLIALRDRGGQDFPVVLQRVLFLAFFFAFAIKVPIFPFHTWLPDAHVDAPTPISVLLAGVLLKMGGYGLIRIGMPLFQQATAWFLPALAILGAINIVYGALVALAQTDFKKMVAYSSVSHMGFVLLGLAGMTEAGFQGALLQMFNHGIITGAMFLLVGVLYDRAHTRELAAFGGLRAQVPVYAGFLIFFGLASLGLPGLSGFVGEFLAFLGAFPTHRVVTIVAVVGVILTAGYTLRMLQSVLLGPLNARWQGMADVTVRETTTLVPLLILVVALGVYPWWLMRIQAASITQLLTLLRTTM